MCKKKTWLTKFCFFIARIKNSKTYKCMGSRHRNIKVFSSQSQAIQNKYWLSAGFFVHTLYYNYFIISVVSLRTVYTKHTCTWSRLLGGRERKVQVELIQPNVAWVGWIHVIYNYKFLKLRLKVHAHQQHSPVCFMIVYSWEF